MNSGTSQLAENAHLEQALSKSDSPLQPPAVKKTAILIGYYGACNLGDELMLVCLHNWLRKQGIAVTIACEDAKQVGALHGMTAVQNYPLLGQFAVVESWFRGKAAGVLKKIAASDIVLAGGGDIIRDEIGWKTFSYQVEKLVCAVLLRKPLYLVNVGITRPVTWYGKAILRWLLPRCRKIIVREPLSLEVCRQLGAGNVTVLAPDIVLQLPDLFPVSLQPPPRPYALICMRGNPNLYRQYEITEERLANLASALDGIVERHQCDVHFLACQTGNEEDHSIHRRIISRMRRSDRTRLLDWTVDPQEISNHFGASRMVVAMRLHAAVLAVAFERPCVLMPYDRKVQQFGKLAGIEHVLDASSLDDLPATEAIIAGGMRPGSAFRYPSDSQNWMALTLD